MSVKCNLKWINKCSVSNFKLIYGMVLCAGFMCFSALELYAQESRNRGSDVDVVGSISPEEIQKVVKAVDTAYGSEIIISLLVKKIEENLQLLSKIEGYYSYIDGKIEEINTNNFSNDPESFTTFKYGGIGVGGPDLKGDAERFCSRYESERLQSDLNTVYNEFKIIATDTAELTSILTRDQDLQPVRKINKVVRQIALSIEELQVNEQTRYQIIKDNPKVIWGGLKKKYDTKTLHALAKLITTELQTVLKDLKQIQSKIDIRSKLEAVQASQVNLPGTGEEDNKVSLDTGFSQQITWINEKLAKIKSSLSGVESLYDNLVEDGGSISEIRRTLEEIKSAPVVDYDRLKSWSLVLKESIRESHSLHQEQRTKIPDLSKIIEEAKNVIIITNKLLVAASSEEQKTYIESIRSKFYLVIIGIIQLQQMVKKKVGSSDVVTDYYSVPIESVGNKEILRIVEYYTKEVSNIQKSLESIVFEPTDKTADKTNQAQNDKTSTSLLSRCFENFIRK